jgi:hypothetical protein
MKTYIYRRCEMEEGYWLENTGTETRRNWKKPVIRLEVSAPWYVRLARILWFPIGYVVFGEAEL